jgi:hypothetical protein
MQATPTPLNPQTVQRIQGWLRTSESIEFRKLLVALATREELDALHDLRQSVGDDGYRETGFSHLDTAKTYEFMLHVLDSAAEGHTPDNPGEKFPYITLDIQQPNAAASVEKLLQQRKTEA